MGLLTVSRELGSGGDVIAKKVANALGWKLLDNDGFANAAQSYGYVRSELERVDERRPGLVDRFFRDRQLVYLDIMRAIVYESALNDNCVILGRGAYILLREIPGVFRVRIVASPESRRKRLVANEGVSPSLAEEFLLHNDRERMSYTRYFFDARWGDPKDFDIVLNTGYIDEDAAVNVLVSAAGRLALASAHPGDSERLQNLTFAQRIKTALMTDDRIDASGISVECSAPGKVLLHGRVNSDEEKRLAEEIVRGASGVHEIQSDLIVMPPIEGWYPV
ncbi:MAG: cytidylate kinase family protein [bacterium]|nr:cytidylate kinase family protein [bacterium]